MGFFFMPIQEYITELPILLLETHKSIFAFTEMYLFCAAGCPIRGFLKKIGEIHKIPIFGNPMTVLPFSRRFFYVNASGFLVTVYSLVFDHLIIF